MTPAEDLLSVTMRVDDWLIIDATIDNTVAMDAVDGDESVVAQARESAKRAGRQAVRIRGTRTAGAAGRSRMT